VGGERRGVLQSFTHLVVRAPWVVVGAWIAVAVGCIFLLPDVKSAKTGSLGDLVATDADAITTEERSVELFLFPVLSRTLVVQHSDEGLSPRAESRIYERASQIRLGRLPGIESIPFALPLTSDVPSPLAVAGGRTDGHPTTALTSLFFPTDIGSEGRTGLAERLVDRYIDRPSDGRVGVTGAVPARAAQVRAITDALPLVELATLLLVIVAVGVQYRSPIAPLVNIITVGLVYTVSLHLTGGIGQSIGIAVPEEVEPVMVALLFGIVTDYSIFFISRFRRYLRQGVEPPVATERAATDLMPTIIAAGLSVAAASAALLAAQLGFFKAFGPGLALSVLVALAVVTTFVPAALAITGRLLFWPSLGPGSSADGTQPESAGNSRLPRLMEAPTRRPLATTVAVSVPLVLLAFATTRMHLANTLISGLPPDSPPRQALREVRKGFEPGVVSPVMILLEGESIEAREPQLRHFQQDLSTRRNVAAVTGPADLQGVTDQLGAVVSPTGDAVRYLAILGVDPLGSRAIGTVARLKGDIAGMLADAGLGDVRSGFAGDTAVAEETVNKTSSDLIRVVPIACGLVLLVLAVFLRALVAPLYLVAASLLALVASLGATTLVFQDLLGFGELSFYVPFAGIVLLIALGSDYNVYLVGEVWGEARHGPLRPAIANATRRARSAITVAGLVLALSFAMLAIVPLRPFRELAFLLCSGLLIDAFVVRSFLAPALIALIGRRSAWPGNSLDRTGAAGRD
jgi:putative drug exporter of the RND superfamily